MQFEYKQVVSANLIPTDDLKFFGEEEWELVCVTTYGDFMVYYFKRTKTIEILQKSYDPLERMLEDEADYPR